MDIFERAVSLIAPHRCVACGVEGGLLCPGCEHEFISRPPARCYRCHKLTRQSAVCTGCRSSVKLSHVWVGALYQDVAKEIVHRYKFARAKSGGLAIAGIIDQVLPYLPKDIIISHIPTANKRVRTRGYDQARLIARHLAEKRGWRHETLLERSGKSRQVGAGRKQRFSHLEKALTVRPNKNLKGRHILLVDDITTTGATVEAAAKTLKEAGAKTIDAVVFAQP